MYGSYKGLPLYVKLRCKVPATASEMARLGSAFVYTSYIIHTLLYKYIDDMAIYMDPYFVQPIHLTYMIDSELVPALHMVFVVNRLKHRWKEAIHSKQRHQKRCLECKEELMMTTWHPRRVEKWLDAGCDVEDM
jgi:hypothetical protein